MRIVVYTAIFGSYDTLKIPVAQTVPCDFVCFTDGQLPSQVGPWRIIRVLRNRSLHPRMQAKWYKLMAHKVFERGRLPKAKPGPSRLLRKQAYSASIWVDGSIAIKGSHFVETAVSGLQPNELALFDHPDRDCIFEEADCSIAMKKYEKQPIRKQVENYRHRGILPHSGLFACGILGRLEPQSTRMKTFNEAWWTENLRWTYQDQLSIGIALSRAGLSTRRIPGNLWRNDYFDWIPHTSAL